MLYNAIKGGSAVPRSAQQKLKILYVMDYLLQNTDEAHPATLAQIRAYLEGRGVTAERKSIYDDLESLREYGLDVVCTGAGRGSAYYIASRDFELPELKLLVDSVQASRFITHKKTAALIKKIERLASVHEARALQRQVFVTGRIKTMNESIYYNIDALHSGISLGRKIRFRYFDLDVQKQRRFRRDGAYYAVSPYALIWDSENYYLVAYDSDAAEIRSYRVDKMTGIAVLDVPRDGLEAFRSLDMAAYSRKVFGMFSGAEEPVRMRFDSHLVGAVLDRLGAETLLIPDGERHFTVTANLVPSPQFYAWLFGFGAMAQLLGPAPVIEAMRAQLSEVAALYAADADQSPSGSTHS